MDKSAATRHQQRERREPVAFRAFVSPPSTDARLREAEEEAGAGAGAGARGSASISAPSFLVARGWRRRACGWPEQSDTTLGPWSLGPASNLGDGGGRLKNARAGGRRWRPSFSYMGAAMRELRLQSGLLLSEMVVLTGQWRIACQNPATGRSHQDLTIHVRKKRSNVLLLNGEHEPTKMR